MRFSRRRKPWPSSGNNTYSTGTPLALTAAVALVHRVDVTCRLNEHCIAIAGEHGAIGAEEVVGVWIGLAKLDAEPLGQLVKITLGLVLTTIIPVVP